MDNKIKVLVIDDSPLVRHVLTEMLNRDGSGMVVVGAAKDAYVAREMIKSFNPDVLTLDIEMPGMNGLMFLENLMRLRPMPVLMVSSLTAKGADATMHALDLGAVDFIQKPAQNGEGLNLYADEIIDKLHGVATARVRAISQRSALVIRQSHNKKPSSEIRAGNSQKLIAIGSSTGGPEAVKVVLNRLPADHHIPGIVITQHIPEEFCASFVRSCNNYSELSVCMAKHGQPILAGSVYIAPGDQHLQVRKQNGEYICYLDHGDPVNHHCPSVDVLFHSVAKYVGGDALGVILTGMGRDGARGLLSMHDLGAKSIAQDEESSIVWGMPGAAYEIGAVDRLLPLDKIADYIIKFASIS